MPCVLTSALALCLGARIRYVHRGAVVGSDLPGWTRLGSHNKVGNYALVGIRCQDMKYKVWTLSMLLLLQPAHAFQEEGWFLWLSFQNDKLRIPNIDELLLSKQGQPLHLDPRAECTGNRTMAVGRTAAQLLGYT